MGENVFHASPFFVPPSHFSIFTLCVKCKTITTIKTIILKNYVLPKHHPLHEYILQIFIFMPHVTPLKEDPPLINSICNDLSFSIIKFLTISLAIAKRSLYKSPSTMRNGAKNAHIVEHIGRERRIFTRKFTIFAINYFSVDSNSRQLGVKCAPRKKFM